MSNNPKKARSVSEAKRKGLKTPDASEETIPPTVEESQQKPPENRFGDRVDVAHTQVKLMGQPLTSEVWASKYKSINDVTPLDTFQRVAQAIYAKDTGGEDHTFAAYDAMVTGLWMPGGRIIAGAGTGNRVTLMNCLGPQEKVSTKEYGTITLEEASKKNKVTLLTLSGWIESEVKCFGIQPLNKIILRPSRSKKRQKVVYATPDHRWISPTGRTITTLYPGCSLLSCGDMVDQKSSDYEAGLFHGTIFGDGQLHRAENFKQFPIQKSGSYIAGFIDGWWVADRHYENGDTQRCISSTNYQHLDWLVENAHLGGYIATGDKIIGKKVTNLGIAKDPCRAITILPASRTFWTVESIEPIGTSPVYCAVVPEAHAFTLTEGLYTGNCYVNRKLDDSLDDIMKGISDAALTQQQGGGIGTDFSTLRPSGAMLQRTGAIASGPLPFMDMWHSMCSTIMSAGSRRGAMMGTLCDTHPDLPEFIRAKQTKGRMTNFNVSVLVSDALMAAVDEDEDWMLYFEVAPKVREPNLMEMDFIDEATGKVQYVYQVIKARELWALITRNTYEYSEPGIIFIDRINDLNNLKYCEEIRCTNPCGEQPLPPNATCNLGAINLARVIKRPFKSDAEVNWDLITDIVKIGMRFLDNVIDVTNYPLLAQEAEEIAKRRTGLGVSGLADCLAQLGLRYGSAPAVTMTERIMQHICLAAYDASMLLAKERGAFPLFQREPYLDGTFAGINLSSEYQERIRDYGIRNGVLLTVAPTGTTSILYGNISSGIEPVFAHKSLRKVRQSDNTFKEYTNYSYNSLLYQVVTGSDQLPAYMVEANALSIEDHIITQAAVQRWIDASVSKTINVSEDCTYDDFQKVYDLAYALGCKGCTTYRPSEVRGSILSRTPETPIVGAVGNSKQALAIRSEVLQGLTHKIRWPSMSSALYVTVNQSPDGYPFEVFFNSKDGKSQEWMTALSLMITAILRKNDGDVQFISDELGSVHSIHDTAWIKIPGEEKPKFFGSLISYIGYILGKDFTALGAEGVNRPKANRPLIDMVTVTEPRVEKCPQCFAPGLIHSEGCTTCNNCGYSNCS